MPEPIDLDALWNCSIIGVTEGRMAIIRAAVEELRALRLERDRLRAALQSELEWLQKWQCMTRYAELKKALGEGGE